MSHQDANPGALDARSPAPDQTLPVGTRPASDTDTDGELAALRRSLLLYGTSGQAARTGAEVKAF